MYLGITTMPSVYFFFYADFGKNKVLIQSNFKSFVYNDLLLSRSFRFLCSFIVRLFNEDFFVKKKRIARWGLFIGSCDCPSGKKIGKVFLVCMVGKSSNWKTVNKQICQLKRDYRLGSDLSKMVLWLRNYGNVCVIYKQFSIWDKIYGLKTIYIYSFQSFMTHCSFFSLDERKENW